MRNHSYLTLINDTLTYLKALLPKNPPPSSPISYKIDTTPPPLPSSQQNEPISTHTPSDTIIKEKRDTKTKEKKEDTKNIFIKLEPPSTPPKTSTDKIKHLLLQIDPEIYLHDNPPSDHFAKQIKTRWKEKRDTPTIPILFQGKTYHSLLLNIAKAIDITFATCRLIETGKKRDWKFFLQSPNIKYIIAPDHLIFSTKALLHLYKELPQESMSYLGNIPLLLLPDLSLYYKDPYLKRSLWNVIIQKLQPLF